MNRLNLFAIALVANALVACAEGETETTTESTGGQDSVVAPVQTQPDVEPIAADPQEEAADDTYDLVQVELERIDTEQGACANFYWDLSVDGETRVDQSAADRLSDAEARVVLADVDGLLADDFRFTFYKPAADSGIALETLLFAANQGADEGAHLVGADVDTFDGENGSTSWRDLRELGGFSGDFNIENATCTVRVRYSVTVVSSGWVMGR